MKKVKMTAKAVARIQRASAKKGGGKVKKGSFAARAQRVASKNQQSNSNTLSRVYSEVFTQKN